MALRGMALPHTRCRSGSALAMGCLLLAVALRLQSARAGPAFAAGSLRVTARDLSAASRANIAVMKAPLVVDSRAVHVPTAAVPWSMMGCALLLYVSAASSSRRHIDRCVPRGRHQVLACRAASTTAPAVPAPL